MMIQQIDRPNRRGPRTRYWAALVLSGMCWGAAGCDYVGDLGSRSDDGTTSKGDTATTETGGRTCEPAECGDIPGIAEICPDGTVVAQVCDADVDDRCAWRRIPCDGDTGGDIESDGGDGADDGDDTMCSPDSCDPLDRPDDLLCPDGVSPAFGCTEDLGVCGWERFECPSPAECTFDECGPAPGAPNYECADGSFGGPGPCRRTADGSCGYPLRDCCCLLLPPLELCPGVPGGARCCLDGSYACGDEPCPIGEGGVTCDQASCGLDGDSCGDGRACCDGTVCCPSAVPDGTAICRSSCL